MLESYFLYYLNTKQFIHRNELNQSKNRIDNLNQFKAVTLVQLLDALLLMKNRKQEPKK